MPTHAAEDEFHLQTRDLYIPAGDIGMWQGALRNPDDSVRAAVAEAIDAREPLSVELLYSDQVGLQRTITRFGLISAADSWLTSLTRHWYLDWDGPRPERDVLAAAAAVQRDQEAAERRAAAPSEMAAAAAAGDGTPAEDGAASAAEEANATGSPPTGPSRDGS